MAEYLHCLKGRVRIRLPQVKGDAWTARQVEQRLQQLPGIQKVSTNPLTGSVLIHYQPHLLAEEQLFRVLAELQGKSLQLPPPPVSSPPLPSLLDLVAHSLLSRGLEMLLNRLWTLL